MDEWMGCEGMRCCASTVPYLYSFVSSYFTRNEAAQLQHNGSGEADDVNRLG